MVVHIGSMWVLKLVMCVCVSVCMCVCVRLLGYVWVLEACK